MWIPVRCLILIQILGALACSHLMASTAANTIATSIRQTRKVTKSYPSRIYDINLGMRALYSDNLFSQSQVFDFRINYLLNYDFNAFLKMKLDANADLQSGSVQSVDASDKLENRFYLLEASLASEWQPDSYATVGIKNQNTITSDILTGERGFFAGGLKQSIQINAFSLGASTFASIPNSESSISEQKEKEGTPSLVSAGINIDWKGSGINLSRIKMNYFKFSNIPSQVSTASVQSGNTAAESSSSDALKLFKYEFEGIDSSIQFKRGIIKNWFVVGDGAYLINQKAIADKNIATKIGASVGTMFGYGHQVQAGINYYRIESDSTISAYSNSYYFRTNHHGFGYGISYLSLKENFKVTGYYTEGRLILENPSQSDEKLFLIKFEVLNVKI